MIAPIRYLSSVEVVRNISCSKQQSQRFGYIHFFFFGTCSMYLYLSRMMKTWMKCSVFSFWDCAVNPKQSPLDIHSYISHTYTDSIQQTIYSCIRKNKDSEFIYGITLWAIKNQQALNRYLAGTSQESWGYNLRLSNSATPNLSNKRTPC